MAHDIGFFGPTPDDLIEDQYRWCVKQQSTGGALRED
jgi:hypothetical protein